MKAATADKTLIAFCGLYCGACRQYLNDKCPGCAQNGKASWCKVRSCCLENKQASCAECRTFTDINQCRYFNNFFSRLFGLIFRSDRRACIALIKEKGGDAFAAHMAENKLQSIKRK